MTKFLAWLLARPTRRIVIVRRDPCRLRLEEWRSSPDLVKMARGFLDNPNFRMLLDTVRNEHPLCEVLIQPTLEERGVAQARSEGYGLALNNLEALASPEPVQQDVEADFVEPTQFSNETH